MNVLISLANLSEQKSLFEVEKIKDKLLDLMNIENIDPGVKFNIVIEKLSRLTDLMSGIFNNMESKITDYEKLAEKRVLRAKDNFFETYKRFLK